jgi:hypothetical protein
MGQLIVKEGCDSILFLGNEIPELRRTCLGSLWWLRRLG